MIRSVISLIFLAFLHTNGLFAQACGRGTFTLKVFQLSGEPVREFCYEILPASLASTYTMDQSHSHRGMQLDRSQIKDAIDPPDQQVLDELLIELGVKKQGKTSG